RELLREFRDVAHASIVGNGVTALVQTAAVTGGLVAAGVAHAPLWGLVTLPASFIPVAGSGLVYLPAAGWLAATGRPLAAAVFLGWCSGVGALNTHLIKPFVVGGRISMHGALTFLSILGGVSVFGMIGLIAGPLAMAFAWTAVRIYRRDGTGGANTLSEAA
ncbi:MAG TPA: AI-2E family transporter, partial [Myxococcota bacterium]|nr:AI-2E family transporter [Myxococcota bacterium]